MELSYELPHSSLQLEKLHGDASFGCPPPSWGGGGGGREHCTRG